MVVSLGPNMTPIFSRTNTTCIFINQLREKIGVMFGNPETTTGGNALKFYASVRIDVRPSTFIKDGEQAIGRTVKAKVVKNKVAPPFMKAQFDIMFGEGISRAGEVLDLAVELGILKKSGSWFSYEGSKLGQGRDAVVRVVADNPELYDELAAKVRAALMEQRESRHADHGSPFLPSTDATRTDEDQEAADPEDDGAAGLFPAGEGEGEEGEIDPFGDDFDLNG